MRFLQRAYAHALINVRDPVSKDCSCRDAIHWIHCHLALGVIRPRYGHLTALFTCSHRTLITVDSQVLEYEGHFYELSTFGMDWDQAHRLAADSS
jgi:hypothetical protein